MQDETLVPKPITIVLKNGSFRHFVVLNGKLRPLGVTPKEVGPIYSPADNDFEAREMALAIARDRGWIKP